MGSLGSTTVISFTGNSSLLESVIFNLYNPLFKLIISFWLEMSSSDSLYHAKLNGSPFPPDGIEVILPVSDPAHRTLTTDKP